MLGSLCQQPTASRWSPARYEISIVISPSRDSTVASVAATMWSGEALVGEQPASDFAFAVGAVLGEPRLVYLLERVLGDRERDRHALGRAAVDENGGRVE